jgi:predicted small lipoprotein YifL
MRNVIKLLSGLTVLFVMAAGCGQKAPLFLPGDPDAVQSDIPGQYQSQPSSGEPDDTEVATDDDDDEK